jgi:RNA polymerase sigma-70 factor (ECF subfamily)
VTKKTLAQLYTQYGALLHRRCRALLGSEPDANDALQETFMRVQRYPPENVQAMLPWLYGVATRVCFDVLAARRRAQPMAQRVVGRLKELMGGVTSGSAEERLSLGSELARLDETTREMAMLHWLDGMTQEEVAQRTGYSRKTVGQKLKGAETVLRAAFSDAVPVVPEAQS